jgi:hypothetical protein
VRGKGWREGAVGECTGSLLPDTLKTYQPRAIRGQPCHPASPDGRTRAKHSAARKKEASKQFEHSMQDFSKKLGQNSDRPLDAESLVRLCAPSRLQKYIKKGENYVYLQSHCLWWQIINQMTPLTATDRQQPLTAATILMININTSSLYVI